MKPLLLDTGPLVALLDRNDAYHHWVAPRFGNITSPLATSGAVVTEATFFLQNVKDGVERLFEFFSLPQIHIFDCFQPTRLHEAADLMRRYADTPMDFADATLVVLAAELETKQVLTLDERGFRTYRCGRKASFHLVLQDCEA